MGINCGDSSKRHLIKKVCIMYETLQNNSALTNFKKGAVQTRSHKFDFCQSGREPLIEVPGQIQLHNPKTSLTTKKTPEVLKTKLGEYKEDLVRVATYYVGAKKG